ncbi:MAG TPA: hypothetical protein VMG10_13260 [Gemmataceae bacterium]|nr:hypothetical protein [Gemmataceae bacterium]
MVTTQHQTVWLPKDSLLFIVLNIPLWGIAGLAWGFAMALFMNGFSMALFLNGSLIIWLFLGLLWGAFVWFFYSVALVIQFREAPANIPCLEVETLPERLTKAVKRLRYTMEQQSSTSFVCKPKRGLARLFEFSKLHVSLLDASVDLIGPAFVVNKLRKQLLADSATRARES